MRYYHKRAENRRIVKLIISLFFFIFVSLWQFIRQSLGQKVQNICVSIYYHEILPIYHHRFAKQLEIITRYTQPIPADFKSTLQHGRIYTIINFCDGCCCFYDTALPELIKRNITATLFIPAGCLGKHPSWEIDCNYKLCENKFIMSSSQIDKLPFPLINVGSHGMTHRNLIHLPVGEAEKELSNSKRVLELITKRNVNLFFFPYGEYNYELIKLARLTGYKRVFTGVPNVSTNNSDQFVFGGISTDPSDWDLEFKLKILGAYRWIPFAISIKKKLVDTFNNIKFNMTLLIF